MILAIFCIVVAKVNCSTISHVHRTNEAVIILCIFSCIESITMLLSYTTNVIIIIFHGSIYVALKMIHVFRRINASTISSCVSTIFACSLMYMEDKEICPIYIDSVNCINSLYTKRLKNLVMLTIFRIVNIVGNVVEHISPLIMVGHSSTSDGTRVIFKRVKSPILISCRLAVFFNKVIRITVFSFLNFFLLHGTCVVEISRL